MLKYTFIHAYFMDDTEGLDRNKKDTFVDRQARLSTVVDRISEIFEVCACIWIGVPLHPSVHFSMSVVCSYRSIVGASVLLIHLALVWRQAENARKLAGVDQAEGEQHRERGRLQDLVSVTRKLCGILREG